MLPDPKSDPLLVGLVGLFQTFMGLADDQVVIYNSDWRIPADDRLYVTVALLAAKPYASANEKIDRLATDTEPAALIERIIINTLETYTVNVFSSTNEALLRNWQIVAALGSTMGEQLQEELGFSLSRLPVAVNDLSGVEGARRLFRYVSTITLQRSQTVENVIQYFDKFPGTPELVINP